MSYYVKSPWLKIEGIRSFGAAMLLFSVLILAKLATLYVAYLVISWGIAEGFNCRITIWQFVAVLLTLYFVRSILFPQWDKERG